VFDFDRIDVCVDNAYLDAFQRMFFCFIYFTLVISLVDNSF